METYRFSHKVPENDKCQLNGSIVDYWIQRYRARRNVVVSVQDHAIVIGYHTMSL